MNRPTFHDVDQIGRSVQTRGRGLDALIPTAPAEPARLTYTEGYEDGRAAEATTHAEKHVLQWKQIEAALFSLTNAQFEYEQAALAVFPEAHIDAGKTHVEDCRRALGTLALTLADGPDAEGYARLFGEVMKAPTGRRGVDQ